MTKKVNLTDINYIQYGNDKGKDIVLLHGWGQNIEMMKPLGDLLADNYHITIIDLPGFGKSKEPATILEVGDYTEIVHDLLKSLKVVKPTLIGHSFGGRISICYGASYDVEKLVLCGAPCVKTKKELTLKEKMLKSVKKLPGMEKLADIAKNYIGSTDYKNASPMMRDILVKVVGEDLSEYAKKIKVPVILIWGEYDEAVPLEEGRMLEKLLSDGAMIVLPGTHYAYLENLYQVGAIINKFMEE